MTPDFKTLLTPSPSCRPGRPPVTPLLILLALMAAALAGCASSGPKMVSLAYTGSPETTASGALGIARFADLRNETPRGELGYRVLNDKSREVYLVQGLDLAATLTDQTQSYLEKRGFSVSPVPPWTPDMEGLAAAEGRQDRQLTANINEFHMTAEKKGAITELVLKADITFFLGLKGEKRLTTIPVVMSLERTEVSFTRKKVETFFNQALAEVLEKALAAI